MKKVFVTTFTLLIALALVGCTQTTEAPTTTKSNNISSTQGNETTKGSESTTVVSKEPSFWDQDGNGIEDWQEQEITLKYATWQYNDDTQTTIDSLMLDAFHEMYPNITVEMQIVGEDYDWDTNMPALAETGELPDVFLIYRLETALPSKYLADITDFYNNDPDTAKIFKSVENAGIFNERRYAVPTFIYPSYWFVNLDILKANNIQAPSYNWTWEQMEAIAGACYNESTHTVGQYGVSSYWREYPKVLSGESDWMAFTYDGEKFNFDSPYFEQAFDKLTEAVQNNVATIPYDSETLLTYYNDEAFHVNYDGKAAIWCAPSWEAKGYFDTMAFNWDVYPGPGGVTCGNIDIAGVSSTCANKAAAYQLLKWMSYSKQGLVTRFELYSEYSEILFKSANNYPYPIVDYGINKYGENEVWDNIPYTNAPGMTSSQMINSLKNGALWGNKEIVGWDSCDFAVNSYFLDIYTGASTFAEVIPTIVELGNPAYLETRAALAELIK